MLLMLAQRLARLRARQRINTARSRLRNPKRGIRKRCRDLLSISTGSQEALPMGKRSGFERREADFYPSYPRPRAAVVPLISHLRGIPSFADPCGWCRRAGAASGSVRSPLRLQRRLLIRSSFVLFASHLISASERAELSGERMSTVKA